MNISTIPANDRRELFTAGAAQTVFPFDFPLYAASDLRVVRTRGAASATLILGVDYAVAGAGEQAGGSITLASGSVAGDILLLDSAMPTGRTSSFADGGDLPAAGLNGEYNRLYIVLQQQARDALRSLSFPANEPTQDGTLPAPASRSNALLGFDAAGVLSMVPRASVGGGSFQQIGAGAVTRTVQDELAGARITPHQFGAAGNGTGDDLAATLRAIDQAVAAGGFLVVPAGTYRITGTVAVPEQLRGIIMEGEFLYAGPGGAPALVLGDGGTTRNANKIYRGIRVRRAIQSDWLSEADIGIQARNLDASLLEVVQAEGFTIGVQVLGDGRGFEDSSVILGRIVDNRIGVDLRCATPGAWCNSNSFYGGHFACSSGTNPTLSRFGVRLSAAPGAYVLHNANRFRAPGFELQRQGTPGTVDAIPFLVEVNARGLVADGVRMEACSPFVARHTVDANDCAYQVVYVGTYAFTGAAIDYPPTATRAAGTVEVLHQAGVAYGATRLVAAAESVRERAFRNVVTVAEGVGFEGLAVLSGNPGGPPTNLTGFAFGGLNLMTLNSGDVTLPTSRVLGFVVDATQCKEFVLAADGVLLRPVVMQFDEAENVLQGDHPVLFSNMNTAWNGAPSYFHEGAADLDGLTGGLAINQHQRVRLAPACAIAIIGVRGSTSSAVLKALRLFCAPLFAPRVLAGGTRAWGSREMAASQAWSVPSLAAGATSTADVTLPGVRQGDIVRVGFAKDSGFQNGGVVFHASVGGTGAANQVRVTAQNVSGGTVVVGDGTLYVQAVRPRR